MIYTLTVTQPRPRQLKKVKTEHYVWTDILENRENQSLFCFVSEKKTPSELQECQLSILNRFFSGLEF